jgi:hypothetical protein
MSGGTPAVHREIRGGEPWSVEPKTNPTRGKAREKTNRHPNGELLLDNADAVIDALHLLFTNGSFTAVPHHLRGNLSERLAAVKAFPMVRLWSWVCATSGPGDRTSVGEGRRQAGLSFGRRPKVTTLQCFPISYRLTTGQLGVALRLPTPGFDRARRRPSALRPSTLRSRLRCKRPGP